MNMTLSFLRFAVALSHLWILHRSPELALPATGCGSLSLSLGLAKASARQSEGSGLPSPPKWERREALLRIYLADQPCQY